MASLMWGIMTIILISTDFQNLVSADKKEDRINFCVEQIQKYCGYKNSSILECAKRVLIHFIHNRHMPNSGEMNLIKEYFSFFRNNLIPGPGMQLPPSFCQHKGQRCNQDLESFHSVSAHPDNASSSFNIEPSEVSQTNQEPRQAMLEYAFFDTWFGSYRQNGHSAIDYMYHITENMLVDGDLPSPVQFCQNKYKDTKNSKGVFTSLLGLKNKHKNRP